MTYMLVNQRDLEYLTTIDEQGSFVSAAQQCNVTQPALSNQVRRIEERLGLVLFERLQNGVQITQAGQRVLDSARDVLCQMRDMADVVRACQDPLSIPVKLGFFPTLAPYAVPLLCTALRESCDGINMIFSEAFSEQLIAQILAKDIDAAMLALPVNVEGIDTVPVFVEDLYLVTPKDHRLANFSSVTEEELPLGDLILLDKGHCLRDQALNLCNNDSVGSNIPTDLRATSMETVVQYVVHGFGCTLLPALAAQRYAKHEPDCRFIKIDSDRFNRTIAFAHRTGCPRSSLIPPIVDAVKQTFPDDIISFIGA